MPYKSRAQQRKFHVMEKQGKLPKTTVDEFDQASKGKKLPERVSNAGASASHTPTPAELMKLKSGY